MTDDHSAFERVEVMLTGPSGPRRLEPLAHKTGDSSHEIAIYDASQPAADTTEWIVYRGRWLSREAAR